MTGRVTMLSLSRWTEKGGSYRTVQRFFKAQHQWAELRWLLIKSHLSETCLGTWVLIGDEVIMTKSGKETHGLGRFFSSIQNQAVSGLCFINISLLHVQSRQLFMVTFSQLLLPQIKTLERHRMLDLKTTFRARKFTRRIINSLSLNAEAFLISDKVFQAAEIGKIHANAE